MKKRPMVLIFTGVLSGSAVVWNIASMTTAFYILAGMCILFVCLYRSTRYVLLAAGLVLGIIFSESAKISMNLDLSQMEKYNKGYITGKVLEVSTTKKKKQAVLLKNEDLEGKILLYTTNDQKIIPGDMVSFEAKMEIWEDASNPGQFSSRHYYFSKRIYYRAYARTVKIQRHEKSYFNRLTVQCRKYLKRQLNKQYNKKVSAFLSGMILGDKTQLSDEVKDNFKESGLIHLLAVSGLHISLAGKRFYELIRKFCGSFIISSIFGVSGALMYCVLTGMSVSSVRAVMMLGVYFLSQVTGEHYDLLSSASLAGIILLILCPYRVYDTGFLYSFTAVFVIGFFQMIRSEMKGSKIKGMFGQLRESVLFCIAIQIGLFPVIIYFQYEAPVFSFLANVAAVPLASMGFMLAVILIIFPCMIFHKIVSLMIEIVLWISRQSYGMFTIGHIPLIWVALFYGIVYLVISRRNKIYFKIRVSLIYTGVLILILIPLCRNKTITFLDVGQGDCLIADTSAGLIVSDGGSSSVDQIGRYRILPYIKYLGYQKIKIAIISHMDKDHYSGIQELLAMDKIEYLGLPEIPKDEMMTKIIKTANEHRTKIFYLSRGRKIVTKDASLEVLHPAKNSRLEKNAASLVLQGKVLGYKILLTGDVEKEGEEQLLSEGLQHAELLKAAHHGSKNSTSSEFLQKVMPDKTIISCGQNNRYGHPHSEMIHRLKTYQTKILRTDKSGAIIFRKKRDS